jgi:biotin operon repressor
MLKMLKMLKMFKMLKNVKHNLQKYDSGEELAKALYYTGSMVQIP